MDRKKFIIFMIVALDIASLLSIVITILVVLFLP